MIDRSNVYAMLTKEDLYASGWEEGKTSKDGTPRHFVSRQTGLPFGLMDWITFAELYIREAKDAYANYCPDLRAVRIRLLKAASLFVSALQCHGVEADLNDIAGVSRTKFPIKTEGLKSLLDDIAAGKTDGDKV